MAKSKVFTVLGPQWFGVFSSQGRARRKANELCPGRHLTMYETLLDSTQVLSVWCRTPEGVWYDPGCELEQYIEERGEEFRAEVERLHNLQHVKIVSREDYEAALERLEDIFDTEGEELELLMSQVEEYEKRHFKTPAPTPREVVEFRVDQRIYK